MEPAKVVARFLDGKTIKGFTNDFSPNKSSFHLGMNPADKGTEVTVSDLKALFFVKDFEGDQNYLKKRTFTEDKVYQGKRITVTLKDGELMTGTVLSYDKNRPGFFLIPSDEEGNNIRVFIPIAATYDVELSQETENPGL